MDTTRMPIAVLVSGGGTNLQALIDAEEEPGFHARIVAVISDRPAVFALERAAKAGIPAEVVPWTGDRTAFTTAICDTAERHGAAALVLAGFMRILAPEAITRFPNRILNVHPSLLPAFPGAHAVPQALAYGVKVTGATVHLVDEDVDHGPIVAQEAVPVHPDDTDATLHARIQTVEHRLLPAAVDALATGRLEVEGRIVRWR